MKIINLESLADVKNQNFAKCTLALGFFDGVHLGHQKVINEARKIADENGNELSVMTFDKSPAVFYGGIDQDKFKYLSTNQRKADLMEKLDVDNLYFISLNDEFRNVTPQNFVDDYICGVNAQSIVAGFDYTFGPENVANMATMENFAKGRFEIFEVPKVMQGDLKVGSSQIKEMLINSDIRTANTGLNYNYANFGKVVHGLQRGRELGFPTANLDINKLEQLPGEGVYATKINVKNEWHNSMTSVGYNITFGDITEISVETNIFDFNEDIYGEQAQLDWIDFIRPQVKFSSADELIVQMKKDEDDIRNILE